jgi:hypothetical protein
MRSVPAAVYDRLDGNAFAQSTIRMAESIQESARLLALHRLTVGKGPGGVNIGIEPSVRLRAAQEFQLFVDLRKATVDVSA